MFEAFKSRAHDASHSHVFGQDQVRGGERRTKLVIIITATMMVVEIIAGIMFGSMALLADGVHMASHTAALTISWAAYVLARRHAGDHRFSFGTGKINSLAAFTSAVLLAGFAAAMAWVSVERLLHPVPIVFDAAIFVAVTGLLVNAVCALILKGDGHAHHDHDHPHDHSHPHAHEHDHNLRSAYLHVLADALTSLTAIAALLCGKLLGWNWMDPLMGIAGSILVGSWSWRLLRDAGRVLLDWQAAPDLLNAMRTAIESAGDCRVIDLHVWSIGPGIYNVAMTVGTKAALNGDSLRGRIPDRLGVVHSTIEICQD